MGVPAYICPDSLLELWRKPVELAGFSVQPLEEQCFVEQGRILHYVGKIASASSHVLLTITEPRGAPGATPTTERMWNLWFSGFAKNHHLAWTIERILLASGAKAIGNPWGCKRVYRSEPELINNWPNYFWTQTIDIILKHSLADVSRDKIDQRLAYPCGVVKQSIASATLFTGPGIDPDTSRDVYYIAIDYGRGLWAWSNDRRIRTLVETIDGILLAHGAKRLDVGEKRKRKEVGTRS